MDAMNKLLSPGTNATQDAASNANDLRLSDVLPTATPINEPEFNNFLGLYDPLKHYFPLVEEAKKYGVAPPESPDPEHIWDYYKKMSPFFEWKTLQGIAQREHQGLPGPGSGNVAKVGPSIKI